MNVKIGLEATMNTPGAVDALTLNLDTDNQKMKVIIIELLGALCILSQDGHKTALDAFTHYKLRKREKFRFLILVDTLHTTPNKDLKVVIMLLINAMINYIDDLEERIALREDFVLLDIDSTVLELKKSEDYKALQIQLEVFQSERERDLEEASSHLEELQSKNPTLIFNAIKSKVGNSESFAFTPFLETMKGLLQIAPKENPGKISWEIATKINQGFKNIKEGDNKDEALSKITREILGDNQKSQFTIK